MEYKFYGENVGECIDAVWPCCSAQTLRLRKLDDIKGKTDFGIIFNRAC